MKSPFDPTAGVSMYETAARIWALGVMNRYSGIDNSKAWANEFLDGYTIGWFEADAAIGVTNDVSCQLVA